MNTSVKNRPTAAYSNGRFQVTLPGGVEISFPIKGNWRFERASEEQLRNVELDDEGIHWPDIDEDLSFAGILRGDWGQYVKIPAPMAVCEDAPSNNYQ